MIDILNRYTRAVLYHSETAQTVAEAVAECQKRANEAGERANLCGADLRGADLRGVDLRSADLCGANLCGVDLCGANLCGVDLRSANLCGVDLRGADLCGVDLRGADLCGANLCGVDLRGVDLRGAKLYGALGLLPNGIIPLRIEGTRHPLIVREPGYITIGCEHHTVAWWEEHYRALAERQAYTNAQRNEYRNYIALAKYWMKTYGVMGAAE